MLKVNKSCMGSDVMQPGLTKSRDTVTLFNLLKRDQGHVGLFSKFCISIGSRLFVVSLSMTSKLRFCPGAFSLMSLMELRTCL